MFGKLTDAMTSWKARGDVCAGLALVQDEWAKFKLRRPMPADDKVIQFCAPFVLSTFAKLDADPKWTGHPFFKRPLVEHVSSCLAGW